ncbi:hypothetical protein BASA81_015736 [Batrachochytrium salamandrivorans]|nr:hypothetical protein BASA81_015736 [Batrachochytrium salamandrivorans]
MLPSTPHPPPAPAQSKRGANPKPVLKHLVLLTVLCALLFWRSSLSVNSLRPIESSIAPPSSKLTATQPLPGILEEEEEPNTSKLLVQVAGQSYIIKRDLPMIRQGYHQAFPNQLSFVRNPRKAPDLVLCLSLYACLGRHDGSEPNNPSTLIVNRIPHLQSVLWSKKAFCESVPKWVASLVSFPCWVLPNPSLTLEDLMGNEGQVSNTSRRWIAKPHASGGGFGIYVVETEHKMREILRSRKSLVIQPFLGNPMLVKKRKVDLRVYVLVTSTSPLRAYVHSRGLVRFASQVYDPPGSNNDDEDSAGVVVVHTKQQSKSQFLTNTSINKKTSKMTAAELTWSFQRLWEEMGEDKARRMRMKMDRSISLILLSVEQKFARLTPASVKSRRYHLLGMDVIFSSNEMNEAKVIEVNGEPSWEGSSLEDAAKGEFAHYDETKIKVAGDVASIVLAPALPANYQYESGEYAHYLAELARESQADTGFRLLYPSAVPGAAGQEVYAGNVERALQSPGREKRLELHRYLVGKEMERFNRQCQQQPEQHECTPSGENGNGRDLVFQDLVKVVTGPSAPVETVIVPPSSSTTTTITTSQQEEEEKEEEKQDEEDETEKDTDHDKGWR